MLLNMELGIPFLSNYSIFSKLGSTGLFLLILGFSLGTLVGFWLNKTGYESVLLPKETGISSEKKLKRRDMSFLKIIIVVEGVNLF
jgi:hypothetical protein